MTIWDADRYARNGRFVADLGVPLVALLAPVPGEAILDIGCGDGALTERIVAAGARVVGIDGSHSFVEAAKARGIDARLGDAQRLTFDAEFDAAFSNAALHWMHDAMGVLHGVYRALRPGGRFVGELGAQGNVASIVTAIIAALEACDVPCHGNPWFFPTPDAYRTLLEAAGFGVESMAAFARPTRLPAGLRPWLETFAHPFFTAAATADRDAVFAHAERYLAPSLRYPMERGSWITCVCVLPREGPSRQTRKASPSAAICAREENDSRARFRGYSSTFAGPSINTAGM